jgi:type II secretory pathway predicted ATPase ExeA
VAALMTLSGSHLNLFAASCDPRRYLPRSATEVTLVRLERRIRVERAGATLLVGPSGIGKSLLLRVFAQRMRRDLRVVSAASLNLDMPTLCALLLDQLRVDAGDDPERALLLCAAEWEARGSALLVLIDDAHELPPATASRLGALIEACDGFKVVAAATEDPESRRQPDELRSPAARCAPAEVRRLARILGADPPVGLRTAMDLEETQAFLKASLAAGWATPELRALFDPVTVARLHRASHGIPGELNRLAAEHADAAVRDGFVPEPGRAVWRAGAPPRPSRSRIVPL